MKLIKLLYFVDREALIRWGRPITFDWYYSLPHGPILSFTLNLINEDPEPNGPTYWHNFISERRVHEVELLRDPPMDQLSDAEKALISEMFERLGHMDQWELRDLSHKLPEWRDPQGSRLSIEIGEILLGAKIPPDVAKEICEALEAEDVAARLLG